MYGLVGEKLSHSFSVFIHNKLGNYDYRIFEFNKDELKSFFEKKDFLGVNITIPYKKEVLKYCDELSYEAKKIGSVNTIKNINGKLYGYNTDYFGLKETLESLNINFRDKKVLILGNGASSITAKVVLDDLGVKEVITASRSGGYFFNEYSFLCDSHIIINTTPVGMYPNNLSSLISVEKFSDLECIVDLVYNPIFTNLLLDGMENKVKVVNGLDMLIVQAMKSSEIFFDKNYDLKIKTKIKSEILMKEYNIVLIGMPGSGKTTIGKKLSRCLDKEFVDTDYEIINETKSNIRDIFDKYGENYFRDIEESVIFEKGKERNQVIATGGGAILRKNNYFSLKQNSLIFYIKRNLDDIEIGERPILKNKEDIYSLYESRKNLYEKYADFTIDNFDLNKSVDKIIEIFKNNLD